METEKMVSELFRMVQDINLKLDLLNGEGWEVNIPTAEKKLGIGAARLREYCENGLIPCHPKNPKAKKIHWVIDILGARKVLMEGGYLKEIEKQYKTRK